MRRKMISVAAKTLVVMFGAMLMSGILATPAFAEVNINVNIGAPPAVVVQERPTMIYLAEPAMYVAVGVPYDIFFMSGRYYYFHGGNWFFAAGYGGPWVHVVHTSLPPGLRKYKVVQLRDFREREYRVYKVQGPKFKGKHFDADPGSHSAKASGKDSHGGGNSGNNGNSGGGRGKGKGRG